MNFTRSTAAFSTSSSRTITGSRTLRHRPKNQRAAPTADGGQLSFRGARSMVAVKSRNGTSFNSLGIEAEATRNWQLNSTH